MRDFGHCEILIACGLRRQGESRGKQGAKPLFLEQRFTVFFFTVFNRFQIEAIQNFTGSAVAQ